MPADPAADEAPQPQCGLCGDLLLKSQACIRASCNVCGSQSLHVWCAADPPEVPRRFPFSLVLLCCSVRPFGCIRWSLYCPMKPRRSHRLDPAAAARLLPPALLGRCATSYAASRVRQHITNSKAIEKRTVRRCSSTYVSKRGLQPAAPRLFSAGVGSRPSLPALHAPCPS